MGFNLDNLKKIEFKTTRDNQTLEKMRAIYPEATEEQLQAGLEALKDYLKVAIKIVNRLADEDISFLTTMDKKSYDTHTKVESNQ